MNIIAERNESIDDILNTTEFPCEKRRAIRIDWHAKAMKALHPVQLVFADPDNGTIGTKSSTSIEIVDRFERLRDDRSFSDQCRNGGKDLPDEVTEG